MLPIRLQSLIRKYEGFKHILLQIHQGNERHVICFTGTANAVGDNPIKFPSHLRGSVGYFVI